MHGLKVVFITLLPILTYCGTFAKSIALNEANTCCTPTEWQAQLYMDYGAVFIDQNTAAIYYNGTGTIAYSFSQKKVYLAISGMEFSPLIPHPVPVSTVMLYDYPAGTQFQVTKGKCDKSSLGKDMPQQCIPGTARLIGSGTIGQGKALLSTYTFSTDFNVTATVYKHATSAVMPTPCEPFHVEYLLGSASTGSGTLVGLSFSDVGPVKDQRLFDVPKECL